MTSIPARATTPDRITTWATARGLHVDHGPAGTAIFSADPARAYRYALTRTWNPQADHAIWVMLNPSTASGQVDDPTIRRIVAFTRRDPAYGGLIVTNLFGIRATDPKTLTTHPAPVGDHNDAILAELTTASPTVIAGWGARWGALHDRAATVTQLLTTAGAALYCLGTSRDGHPRHPLYLRADAPFRPYRPTRTHPARQAD